MSITPFFHVYHKYVFNMANINKIRLSGQTYDIQDPNASKTVELTQAQYDALTVKDPNTFYIITDATAGDLSNYYTKTEVDTALASKQTTLTAGTGISIVDNVISATGGGGGVNVVQTTGTSTTDVMSQDAVTTQLNNKANKSAAVGGYSFGSSSGVDYLKYKNVNNTNIGNSIYYPKINGKGILTNNSIYAQNNFNFQLVETSAITTSVSSSSTDAQIPSAKSVNDKLGGLSLVKLTQAEYDALATKDDNTVYVIVN